jgi:enterochelin esterase-like enzyme
MIKKIFFAILLCVSGLAGYGWYESKIVRHAAFESRMAAWPGPRITTSFSLDLPNARQVYLAGEMTDWDDEKIAMTKGRDGVWRVSLALPAGQWVYKFVVDNKWIGDPGNPLSDKDGRGGRHSFVLVGNGDWNVPPNAPRGEVKTFVSPSGTRTHIYLPPGYQRNKVYPLLLMLHGAGMDADQWYKTGLVNRFMDSMIHAGKIRPFIVVLPEARGYQSSVESALVDQLLPQLQKDYGISLGSKDTAVTGISMGGFGALYLALRHPRLFGFSLPVSGAVSDSDLTGMPRPLRLPFRLHILCGRSDFLVDGNRALRDMLKTDGVEFDYQESNGAHEWHYWNQQLPAILSRVDMFFQTAL